MFQVGVWEPEGSLSSALAGLSGAVPCLVRACCAPCPVWNVPLDLLVVAPHTPRVLHLPGCRAALAPGDVPPPHFATPPQVVLSYGCAPWDTLTLSSLTHARAAVAVQREFPTLTGGVVERQELVVPRQGLEPMALLAQVGAALLLGAEMPDKRN